MRVSPGTHRNLLVCHVSEINSMHHEIRCSCCIIFWICGGSALECFRYDAPPFLEVRASVISIPSKKLYVIISSITIPVLPTKWTLSVWVTNHQNGIFFIWLLSDSNLLGLPLLSWDSDNQQPIYLPDRRRKYRTIFFCYCYISFLGTAVAQWLTL